MLRNDKAQRWLGYEHNSVIKRSTSLLNRVLIFFKLVHAFI